MFRRREPDLTGKFIPLALGATAGLAAGLFFLGRTGRELMRQRSERQGLETVEHRIVDRLIEDDMLADRPIEVGALADGIIELSGSVHTADEARRVVSIAQSVDGVRTVLNRLEVRSMEEHLEDTRRRYASGDASLHETHWYGVRVGTGTRRQGRGSEPAQRDDRVDSIERALGTDRSIDNNSEAVAAMPNAVEGHSSGRGSGYSEDDDLSAGDPTVGDPNPYSGAHQNVKPGDELELERLGG
jgi:hypothetical protein